MLEKLLEKNSKEINVVLAIFETFSLNLDQSFRSEGSGSFKKICVGYWCLRIRYAKESNLCRTIFAFLS